jgi:DNA-binding transcriptional LysR family regulator
MDRLREMEAFIRIVDRGSLTLAAESLDVSLPTVVRLLAGLEKRLGVRLLQRTTRRIGLTGEGFEFYERSKRILAEIDEAEAGSSGAVPRGQLNVTSPILFGQRHLQPEILEFVRMYPEVSVELTMIDRYVDLIEWRQDIGVRVGPLVDSSLVAHPVGDVRIVICASPDYLARAGTPRQPRDLLQHSCLRFSGFARPPDWSFMVGSEVLRVPVSGSVSVNQVEALIEACVEGMGFARLLSYQVAPQVASGQLQLVLEEFHMPARPVSVVVPSARLLPTRTRRLVDWLRERLPPRLEACRL